MKALCTAAQSDPVTALAIAAIILICFIMERRRSFARGYAARGHDVLANTLVEQRSKTSIRI